MIENTDVNYLEPGIDNDFISVQSSIPSNETTINDSCIGSVVTRHIHGYC